MTESRETLNTENTEYLVVFNTQYATSDPHKTTIESTWGTSNMYRMPYRIYSHDSVSFKKKKKKTGKEFHTILLVLSKHLQVPRNQHLPLNTL